MFLEIIISQDGDGASSSFAQEEEEKQQSGIGGGIDGAKWEAVKAAADLPRGCSRLLARFACGMFSPHISSKGLSKHKLYGSMADHDFRAVLKVSEAELPIPTATSPPPPPALPTLSGCSGFSCCAYNYTDDLLRLGDTFRNGMIE